MADGDKQYQEENPRYLNALLELAWETQEAMFDAEEARRDSAAEQEVAEFKRLLRRLYFRYRVKFWHVSKVELDDELRDRIAEVGVRNLEFDAACEVCRTVTDLQEALGHTQFERPTHHEEGFGETRKKGV
jgi:hypothetical protein